jgi:hypothetical protein
MGFKETSAASLKSFPGFNEQVQHLKVAELVHLGGYGKEI